MAIFHCYVSSPEGKGLSEVSTKTLWITTKDYEIDAFLAVETS